MQLLFLLHCIFFVILCLWLGFVDFYRNINQVWLLSSVVKMCTGLPVFHRYKSKYCSRDLFVCYTLCVCALVSCVCVMLIGPSCRAWSVSDRREGV